MFDAAAALADGTLVDEVIWLYLDIETRSAIDLITKGVYVYAEHPSTAIILMSWAIDDGPISTWYILRGDPMPDELCEAILNPRTRFVAHNAGFERVLLTVVGRRFLQSDIWSALRKIERWTCTAARSALMGLPRALDSAAKALHMPVEKDAEGKALMLMMCRPRGLDEKGRYLWHDLPWQQIRLGAYCEVDVIVEREIHRELPLQSDFEYAVWCTTERMNDRGIQVDTELLRLLLFFTEDAEALVNQQISEKTKKEVTRVTKTKRLEAWCIKMGLAHAEGEKGIGKWVIAKWLEDESLPPLVREVLMLRKEGAKSSTSKFAAIASRLNLDHIIRGSLLYCGAASTTRFSSRGAQLQNLVRGTTVKDMTGAIDDMLADVGIDGIRRHGPPLVVASEMARPVFVAAKGHWLVRGDYSQIEARVNAWIAGELWKIIAFGKYDRKEGPDLYTLAAAAILGISPQDVDEYQRQTGKVGELACGFQGGYRAILAMARLYNLKLTEEQAEEFKVKWREANTAIVGFWKELDDAAILCMMSNPGTKIEVRPGLWFKRNNRALALRLPSGGALIYWYPELRMVKTPWGSDKLAVTFTAEDSQKHIWVRHTGYGGLFCENVCQKLARDIMADALVRLDAAGLDPRLTVHDEAVCQISMSRCETPKDAAMLVKDIMMVAPDWTGDLPIAVDVSAAWRYLKPK